MSSICLQLFVVSLYIFSSSWTVAIWCEPRAKRCCYNCIITLCCNMNFVEVGEDRGNLWVNVHKSRLRVFIFHV